MDSPGSPFVDQPQIFTADFAFIVIFAVLSFGQLVLVLLLTVIKMTRKPRGDAFGTVTEQEVRLLHFHRGRFAILMAVSLISLVIVYSMSATSTFYGFIPFRTYLDVTTTGFAFYEIRNVFFLAVLIAVLDSGIKVSQLRHYTANTMQGGTNVNVIVMSCIVAFLPILAIARIVVVGELNVDVFPTQSETTTLVAESWAQFGLTQVRIFIDVVLAIYYSIVTISLWRKKRMLPHEPNEADKSYGFRVLDRIVILVCPLLLLLTLYIVISDPIANTVVPRIITTQGDYMTFLSFAFADDFIWGVITILLNFAIISVGYVL